MVYPWNETLPDGRVVAIRPLTVRQRIALTNELADIRASEARKAAEIAGLPVSLQAVEKARRDALVASALVLDCYTLAGSLRVLCAASEFGELIADSVDAKRATEIALRALGFGGDDREEKQAGN